MLPKNQDVSILSIMIKYFLKVSIQLLGREEASYQEDRNKEYLLQEH